MGNKPIKKKSTKTIKNDQEPKIIISTDKKDLIVYL